MKEEVNDIHSSPLKNLPSESKPADFDPADPDKREREEEERMAQERAQRLEDERVDRFKNNAFLQTLRSSRARPPSQQTSLRGWQPATGPGKPGYHTGAKKNWNDAPKVRYIEGRGRVVAWG